MKKSDFLKMLESVPDDAEIFHRNFDGAMEYIEDPQLWEQETLLDTGDTEKPVKVYLIA